MGLGRVLGASLFLMLQQPIQYVRTHPFSTMALANLIGDCMYLGYACSTGRGLNVAMLLGTCMTFAGHIILFAAGDRQAAHYSAEAGAIAQFLLQVRRWAKQAVDSITHGQGIPKPVFVAFALLSLNGIGFLVEAVPRLPNAGAAAQSVMGGLILTGCIAFMAADLVQSQKIANFLTKFGAGAFSVLSLGSITLSGVERNPFVIVGTLSFLVANYAGFFTKIHKDPA
jgi:hypothetical protein